MSVEWAYIEERGEWTVSGRYDGPDNVVLTHKGEVVTKWTVPGYRIWNYAAHIDDLIEAAS